MKKKKRNRILIFVLVILILACVIGATIYFINNFKNNTSETTVKKETPKPIVSTEESFNTSREVEDFEIRNIHLEYLDDATTLTANIYNNTSETVTNSTVVLTLLDKNGNALEQFDQALGVMEPGQSEELYMSVAGNLLTAYDYKIEVVK